MPKNQEGVARDARLKSIVLSFVSSTHMVSVLLGVHGFEIKMSSVRPQMNDRVG